ncbi:MAG TPA: leucyl aminopeptidase [bacterium]|nr:leucyl aminopeptidase [bacterium]
MKIRSVTAAQACRGEAVFVLLPDGRVDSGEALAEPLKGARATGDLKTSFRAVGLFHQPKGAAIRRLGTIGLGGRRELDTEKLRRAAALAQQRAEKLEVASFALVVPKQAQAGLAAEDVGRALAEGLVLGAYRYDAPRKERAGKRFATAAKVAAVGLDRRAAQAFARGLQLGAIAAEGAVFARDLENQPANLLTPTAMAAKARRLAGGRLKVKVLDERAMAKLKMGALLGVSRGSRQPARLIVFEYRTPGAKGNVAVVGKGLTFDSGGISIKPSARMDEMRYDMCGAGAVMGLFHALRHGALGTHKPKKNLIGVIAAAENMPDADAQRPGDVVRAMDGHTIEVLNTDAEGRLVLADAICYAKKFYQPEKMCDLATLTGAVVVALGHECAGIMGNDQTLVDELIAAGKRADEPLWQLPLWQCHKDQVKSKFADLANINSPAHGNGSTAGGAFLSYFVGDTPWAHLDIAGAAYGALPKDHYTGGATGTAVRTLVRWAGSL